MNLHAIASGAIGAVNPFITGTIQISTGYTPGADFSQIPTYAAPITASMQVQALTEDDLQKIDGINIQSNTQAVFLNGNFDGVVRPQMKGGDLMTFNGVNWLVIAVTEQWPDWCRLLVCLQQ